MTNILAAGGIEQVIKGGYCIGCGGCAVKDSNIIIRENNTGLYQASKVQAPSSETNNVCPFSSTVDENVIGHNLYGASSQHDPRIGYYNEIYAGHVTEGEYRTNGSSGGLVTWVLDELMSQNLIDAVIHVGELNTVGELFGYKISHSRESLRTHSKSKYYPVHITDVMKEVQSSNLRYAFVGVPCFVKAVRLLALNDPIIAERVKFCVAIFCGHLKTKAFSEMIGWQQGVPPKMLTGIDFRVKTPDAPANKYSIQVSKKNSNNTSQKLFPVQANRLYGMDWGLGYFKPKACDWCDDIAGETADLACGDAWLKEYDNDPGGNNILVARNLVISNILAKGVQEGRLHLQKQTVDKVYESQAGNYRHRQEGLSVRIKESKKMGIWFPKKRFDDKSFSVPEIRTRIYLLRSKIAERSQFHFLKSKDNGSFTSFVLKMAPLEIKYFCLTRGWLRGIKKGLTSLVSLTTNKNPGK